jgi:hypothetical protein
MSRKKREVALLPISTPEPWTATLIPVSDFPVPEDERSKLRDALGDWCARLAGNNNLAPSTWLQMNHFHLDQGAQKLSANGRTWLPMTGLGVWPDREPPRLWTKADFEDREYGQPLPPLMHTVFHVSGGTKASTHARDFMIGTGTVVSALLEKDAEQYHQVMREFLLPPITEEALQCHPFYIPLLEAKSLRNVTADLLDSWMGPARVYLRESVEDQGLLLISASLESMDELARMLQR